MHLKRWTELLLAVAFVGALGTAWFQYNRLQQAEQILGKYWSNNFASVFSNLGVVNQQLHRIAKDGELVEDTGVLMHRALRNMTLHLTNTLGDAQGYMPNVPHAPNLVGYLNRYGRA